eukprot:gene10411-3200_t
MKVYDRQKQLKKADLGQASKVRKVEAIQKQRGVLLEARRVAVRKISAAKEERKKKTILRNPLKGQPKSGYQLYI